MPQYRNKQQFCLDSALATCRSPSCLQCFPDHSAIACLKSSAAIAAVLGYLLPTGCLRFLEQRRRAAFASQLRSAASVES